MAGIGHGMWTRTQGMDSDTDTDMNSDTDTNRNGPHVEAYKNSPIHRAMTKCALFIPRLKMDTKIN